MLLYEGGKIFVFGDGIFKSVKLLAADCLKLLRVPMYLLTNLPASLRFGT